MEDEEETQDTQVTDTGTTPTPAPAPVVSLPQYAKSDVFAPDGKRWQDKFHGAQGYAKQQQADRMTAEGELAARLESTGQSLSESAAQVSTLQTEVATLTEKLTSMGVLEEQVSVLKTEADKASRYKVAMRYPGLLEMQVSEEITKEDGETVTVVSNPVLELIEASGMDNVMLEMTLKKMNAALSETRKAQSSAMTPAVPPAAPPAGNDKQAWIAKADAAQEAINSGDMSQWDAFNEAALKIKQLEIEEATQN